MRNSLKLNPTGGLQIFQLLRFGQLFLAGILLARSPAGFEVISAYESLLLVSGLLSFFWVNGLIQSLLSQTDESDNVLFSRTFIYALILSSIAGGFFMLAKTPIQSFLGKTEDIPHYLLIGLFIIINGPGLITEYLYLRKDNPVGMVSYAIVVFGLQISFLLFAAFWGSGIRDILIAMVLGASLRFIWAAILVFREGWSFKKIYSGNQLNILVTLSLVTLIGGSAEYIDGLLIRSFFGAESFVYFRYGARELPFTLLLANALSASFVFKTAKENITEELLSEIKEKSLKLMHYLFPVSIALIFLSPYLYGQIFGEGFKSSANIFNIYILLITSRLVFPQSILTGLNKGRIQLIVSLFELILNIGLSLYLLDKIGIEGVAIATVIAYYIEKLLLALYLHYKHGISLRSYIPMNFWLSYSLILVLCFILMGF